MLSPRIEAIDKLNRLGKSRTPFFFFTDFLADKAWIKPLVEIDTDEIKYRFPNRSNTTDSGIIHTDMFALKKSPKSREKFEAQYEKVISRIKLGDSFLLNLTCKTPIQTNYSLDEIFKISDSKYKLYYKDRFVLFSPESFVTIKDKKIYSFPMKGTIDASLDEAESRILGDDKELAEHITIVDLIRNDLSRVADNVQVAKFRYTERIQTNSKDLIQVSSKISGKLNENWPREIGSILFSLLPAGSITGAPKKKTVEIIRQVEDYDRDYYTGVCGLFDGEVFDSAVMIRFIEMENGQKYYKSGGGITSQSEVDKEYQEMIDKIYVPLY